MKYPYLKYTDSPAWKAAAAELAALALDVLGYKVDTSPAGCASDATVARIVKACAALIA